MSNIPSINPPDGVASYWDGTEWKTWPTTQEVTEMATSLVGDAAATGNAPEGHVYLSTGCFHGEHNHCSDMVGTQGEKRPATCKFCEAFCICACHETQDRE